MVEGIENISKRRRRVRRLGEPHPWEPRHMRLMNARFAEAVGDPAGARNITLGVIKHLWRSPVPFVGFYPPEGVPVTGNRPYSPAPPRLIDDAEYLAGVEEHKRSFARRLQETMVCGGELSGYFCAPTESGWTMTLDLVEQVLDIYDARGEHSRHELSGDVAPFVWAYRNCGFCVISIYDKDIQALRDDLLFFAKREGVELRWRTNAA
ncbi:hypothetical protein [Rubrobacter naiadicus]|uniref:hypothetical protein n=1 Tax=Rubrobacter naiadicus TaxID=1392641 RepID=UPI00235F2E13|nr:hypothetical protein [Rubrobacter naiadicus]